MTYDVHWLKLAAEMERNNFQQRLIDCGARELRDSHVMRRLRVVNYQLGLGADLCYDCRTLLDVCLCHERGSD